MVSIVDTYQTRDCFIAIWFFFSKKISSPKSDWGLQLLFIFDFQSKLPLIIEFTGEQIIKQSILNVKSWDDLQRQFVYLFMVQMVQMQMHNRSRNIPTLPELVQQPKQRNFRLCLLLIRLWKGCAKHIYQKVSMQKINHLCTLFSELPVYLLYPL